MSGFFCLRGKREKEIKQGAGFLNNSHDLMDRNRERKKQIASKLFFLFFSFILLVKLRVDRKIDHHFVFAAQML
jgi:hypothetical protein